MPIEELAKKSLVIEVKGLSEKIARFTINIIFYALFLYRIASGQRGNTLRNLVVVDEGKWLAPPGFNEKRPAFNNFFLVFSSSALAIIFKSGFNSLALRVVKTFSESSKKTSNCSSEAKAQHSSLF